MSEIPDDIQKTACTIVDNWRLPAAIAFTLAKALMAERERCAKLCEDIAMQSGGALTEKRYSIYTVGSADMAANNVHPGMGYAALIREGFTPPKPSSEPTP